MWYLHLNVHVFACNYMTMTNTELKEMPTNKWVDLCRCFSMTKQSNMSLYRCPTYDKMSEVAQIWWGVNSMIPYQNIRPHFSKKRLQPQGTEPATESHLANCETGIYRGHITSKLAQSGTSKVWLQCVRTAMDRLPDTILQEGINLNGLNGYSVAV